MAETKGWKKISEHQFTYNEGSLNFTLTGGAFHDDDGDGVPDGVSFENGRPVFMNIKNLKDFHFDVPRGYIVVNGNEYKLLDLDNNVENGEELQLFKENVGFPQGNDRTNAKAYQKVNEHQFTYNEGSLHYTLTGSAFNDKNGDNIPDGVYIIGPKPSFGADGTKFDTSVENFHFKVPSGVLMVNGERYDLAELDGNPNNGYELVVPEKAQVDGWSKIEKPIPGWAYRRGSDNNPLNKGSFKLFGEGLVDKNGDGNPDGVDVPVVIMGQEENGVRVTRIGFTGLSGDVKLNHPQFSLGVFNDDNYDYEIVKHGGDLYQTKISKISNGAIVNVTSGTEVITTEPNAKINVLAQKSFTLNGKKIQVEGEKYLTIQNNKIISEEILGWKRKGNELEYNGRPTNDPTQKVKFKISGNQIDENELKITTFRKVKGIGVSVGIDGLKGEVKINGKSLGITGDDSYEVHFNPIIDKNIKPENMAQAQAIELLKISPNSTIKANGSWIILEGDGTYHFAKGEYYVSTKPAHSPSDLTKIKIDKDTDINIAKGEIVPTEGLSLVSGATALAEGIELLGEGITEIIFKSIISFVENVASFFDFSIDDEIQIANNYNADSSLPEIFETETVNSPLAEIMEQPINLSVQKEEVEYQLLPDVNKMLVTNREEN